MTTEEPGSCAGSTLLSVQQPDSNRLRARVLLDGMNTVLFDVYAGVQNAVEYFIHPAAGLQTSSSESFVLDSQHDRSQQVTVAGTDLERGNALGTTLRNENNPFTLEADSPEEAVHLDAAREDGSHDPSQSRPRRTWKWVIALIVVILFLIMLPGLILWLVTRQVAWGLAISGTVAPAVVFFGGLYYHHNR